jgi:hypothetical protein
MEQDTILSDAEKGQVRVQSIGFPALCSSMRRQAGLTAANAPSPRLDHENNTDSTVLDSLFLPCFDLAQTSF